MQLHIHTYTKYMQGIYKSTIFLPTKYNIIFPARFSIINPLVTILLETIHNKNQLIIINTIFLSSLYLNVSQQFTKSYVIFNIYTFNRNVLGEGGLNRTLGKKSDHHRWGKESEMQIFSLLK